MGAFSDALTLRMGGGRVEEGKGEASIIGSDPHPLLVSWAVPATGSRVCTVHLSPLEMGVSGLTPGGSRLEPGISTTII